MSLRRGDIRDSGIDLNAIISFLRLLLIMAGGITVLTVCGMVLAALSGQELIVYEMTLVVNVILLVGGGFLYKLLKTKCRQLEEKKEKEA